MSVFPGNDETSHLAEAIITGIQEKKGKDIVCLNLKEVEHAVCEYFIISHGDSNRQVSAISRSIEDKVQKSTKEKPWHKEGKENADWVLLDYVNIVVHIFCKEVRQFYSLEELWADKQRMEQYQKSN